MSFGAPGQCAAGARSAAQSFDFTLFNAKNDTLMRIGDSAQTQALRRQRCLPPAGRRVLFDFTGRRRSLL